MVHIIQNKLNVNPRKRTPLRNDIKVMKTNIHKATITTATDLFSKMTWFIRYDKDDEQIERITSFDLLFYLSIISYIIKFHYMKVCLRLL